MQNRRKKRTIRCLARLKCITRGSCWIPRYIRDSFLHLACGRKKMHARGEIDILAAHFRALHSAQCVVFFDFPSVFLLFRAIVKSPAYVSRLISSAGDARTRRGRTSVKTDGNYAFYERNNTFICGRRA